MKSRILVLTSLIIAVLTSAGYGQSLADLARKEKERREAVKGQTKVITNEQAAKYKGASVTTVSLPVELPAAAEKAVGEGEGTAAAAEAEKPKPATNEPVDIQGRTESYWRQTFADARKRIQDLENQANVLILRLNDLQNQFYSQDDGFKRQAIQRDMQKTIYEQDVNKTNLEQARADLVDLEQEARKSGALPGWIREEKK